MGPVREADKMSRLPLDDSESSHDAPKSRYAQIMTSEGNMVTVPSISREGFIRDLTQCCETHSDCRKI